MKNTAKTKEQTKKANVKAKPEQKAKTETAKVKVAPKKPIQTKAAKAKVTVAPKKPTKTEAAKPEPKQPAKIEKATATVKSEQPVKAEADKIKPAEAKTGKPAAQAKPKKKTKQDTVLELLARPDGATNQEIMDATGWQTHSVRGFISTTIRKLREANSDKTIGKYMRTGGVAMYKLETKTDESDEKKAA